MTDIYKLFAENSIEYERYDHPPIFTVKDVKQLTLNLPGAKTKNLFIRDGKGKQHFLVVVGHDKAVDLKAMQSLLGVSRLSFASPDRLMKYLGITPGAVSLLAVVNDVNKDVGVVVDKDLWESEKYQFHPLVNTSTLIISKGNLNRFLDITGHKIQVLEVPARLM
ncbi:MAG: prolyl-tRNA synthetase associated domain-containing protein [Desulfobacteraceae bacterium]|nr:prolyl-tRNA synthetase associated domain-containing protein [Desulfobacteraceae bacterium]